MAIRITNQKQNMVRSDDQMQAVERKLSASEVQRMAGVRSGDAIICTQGILWVTQEGDREDYMLQSGEQFVANRHGVVVVEAMTDASIRCSKN